MARVKKAAIREVIRSFLFEAPSGASIKDMNYGIYNRPGPSWDEDEDVETTVPDDVPLKPTEMMSNQLVDERPPIEDDEFVPSNPEELSRAARALSQMVPDGQVDFFYKNLHRLLDKATDRDNSPDLAPTDAEEKEKETLPVKANKEQEKKEAFIRRNIQFLVEQMGDDDYDDYRYGGEAPDGYQEVDLSEFEPAAQAAVEAAPDQPAEGMTFEDLAGQFGFSGVPGVRQYIDRITSRMEHFVTKTKPEDIETLQDQAVQEYIDLMSSSGYIDDEDVVELQQAPGEVKSLDSFRFFFVSAFVLPAYQQISRDAKKRVKTELDSMGVPEKMRQTVINQVTGQASRDRGAIAKKLSASAEASNMSPEDREALAQRLTKGFPTLMKLAELDEDLVKIAMAKWGSINPAKRSALIKQSLESTSEFQQQFENV
jgi:hypothetical protein